MGKLTTVCVLLILGSVIGQSNNDLWGAAKYGNLANVEKALAAGANPNWRNPEYFNWTALHTSTGYRFNPKHGDDEWASLYLGSKTNYLGVVNALLAAGANPDQGDYIGTTALHTASSYNQTEIVNALLDAGANPDLKDINSETPLTVTSIFDHPDIVRMLLNAGADSNHQDKFGKTALFEATTNDNVDVVKILLDSGADPNIPYNDAGRMTPLMEALNSGYLDIAEALINENADVNLCSEWEDTGTALFYAVYRASTWHKALDRKVEWQNIVSLLLRKGANANVTNEKFKTPSDIAREKGDTLDLANIIDNYSGPYDHTPSIITCDHNSSSKPEYGLNLLACDVIFISATLYSVLN